MEMNMNLKILSTYSLTLILFSSLVQAEPLKHPTTGKFNLRLDIIKQCGYIDPPPSWCFKIPDNISEWKQPPLVIPTPLPDPLPITPYGQ
jgi:hypothetical protein